MRRARRIRPESCCSSSCVWRDCCEWAWFNSPISCDTAVKILQVLRLSMYPGRPSKGRSWQCNGFIEIVIDGEEEDEVGVWTDVVDEESANTGLSLMVRRMTVEVELERGGVETEEIGFITKKNVSGNKNCLRVEIIQLLSFSIIRITRGKTWSCMSAKFGMIMSKE